VSQERTRRIAGAIAATARSDLPKRPVEIDRRATAAEARINADVTKEILARASAACLEILGRDGEAGSLRTPA